jgi:hypothetical protein
MKGSRKLRIVAAAAMLGLLALAVAVGASAAKSKAGLDRSYGDEGVAAVQLPSEPAGGLRSTRFATASDGSAYQLNTFGGCSGNSCGIVNALYRWGPNGTSDASFGGSGFAQVSNTTFDERIGPLAEGTDLTVDSYGRPLVSVIESGLVVVRRFSPGGVLDASFGSGGSITVPCGDCERAHVWLLAAPKGRSVVEVQNTVPAPEGGNGSALGGKVTLTRLTSGGWPERSFGAKGTAAIELGLRSYPGAGSVTPAGGVLLGAAGCCDGTGPYLIRVSKKGRIDTKFGRAAGRSLARLAKQGETSSLAALLPRANGTIELVGNDLESGFDLRLKANGDRARFGDGGLKKLPFLTYAAALGAEGAIFAIGSQGIGPFAAFRVLANGRIDPHFGEAGIQVPLSGSGFALGTPARGKALVFDAGNHECRGSCGLTPGIARFDEGASKG